MQEILRSDLLGRDLGCEKMVQLDQYLLFRFYERGNKYPFPPAQLAEHALSVVLGVRFLHDQTEYPVHPHVPSPAFDSLIVVR